MTVALRVKGAIRSILENALKPFGYQLRLINSKTTDSVVFDRKVVLSFLRPDATRRLYEEGIRRADSLDTDNFAKQCRFYSLIENVQHVLRQGVQGDVAECGCWRGHSSYMIAKTLGAGGFNSTFHIFDSFEGGLSELGKEDQNARGPLPPEEVKFQKESFASSEEQVGQVLAPFPFVRLYAGWIPDRFPEVKDAKFRFVHIDVDLYQPTVDSLNFFFPRLERGGVMTFDDYGMSQFPGTKQAVDEYLSDKDYQLFYEIPTGGGFLLK
jgi:hypothetical protein